VSSFDGCIFEPSSLSDSSDVDCVLVFDRVSRAPRLIDYGLNPVQVGVPFQYRINCLDPDNDMLAPGYPLFWVEENGVRTQEMVMSTVAYSNQQGQDYTVSAVINHFSNCYLKVVAKDIYGVSSQIDIPVRIELVPPVFPAETTVSLPQPILNIKQQRMIISLDIAEETDVLIDMLDNRGLMLKHLINEHKTPGSYTVSWDGTTENGDIVASGICFVHAKLNNKHVVKKAVIIK
jgi:hypothetical protein